MNASDKSRLTHYEWERERRNSKRLYMKERECYIFIKNNDFSLIYTNIDYVPTSPRQAKFFLGTEELPEKQSALCQDNKEAGDERPDDNQEEEKEDELYSKKLPSKIDSFVEYINNTYMKDSQEISGKELLKMSAKEAKKKKKEGGGGGGSEGRRIYNGDDSRGAAPISRRTWLIED